MTEALSLKLKLVKVLLAYRLDKHFPLQCCQLRDITFNKKKHHILFLFICPWRRDTVTILVAKRLGSSDFQKTRNINKKSHAIALS